MQGRAQADSEIHGRPPVFTLARSVWVLKKKSPKKAAKRRRKAKKCTKSRRKSSPEPKMTSCPVLSSPLPRKRGSGTKKRKKVKRKNSPKKAAKVRSGRKKIKRQAGSQKEGIPIKCPKFVRCARCGREIAVGAGAFCTTCGHSVERARPYHLIRCPYCGSYARKGEYCPHCGNGVTPQTRILRR